MAIFITQGNYSEQAMKGMVENPEDRLGAVTGLMESVGAKLLQYYVTTGEYDFLVVTEADNLVDMVSGLLVAGSPNRLSRIELSSGLKANTPGRSVGAKRASTGRRTSWPRESPWVSAVQCIRKPSPSGSIRTSRSAAVTSRSRPRWLVVISVPCQSP